MPRPGTARSRSLALARASPEEVEIHATPTFGGENVVGATVQGTVARPGASPVPIVLFDDGQQAHADAMPNDGVYSARFAQYSDDGTYIFDLTATVTDGTTYAGEDLFGTAPSNAKPVPDFVRAASATAVVTGVPDFVIATVEYGPETINLRSEGRYVTAYIELPEGFEPAAIDVGSVAVTAVGGAAVAPIPAQSHPIEVGDFDSDGIPDLMVKLDRKHCRWCSHQGCGRSDSRGWPRAGSSSASAPSGSSCPAILDPSRETAAPRAL